jgi:hypothetical protein
MFAPWQEFWLELRSFIASVPVWVTVWLLPGPKSELDATTGIEKLSVVELAFVSNDSHVVCSVPLLLQVEPFHDEPAPVQACTADKVMLPSFSCPEEGLLTVKLTVEDVPGYSVLAEVPVTVRFEALPTAAVPDPVPVEVK